MGLGLGAAAIWWFYIRGRRKAEVPPTTPHEAPTEAIGGGPAGRVHEAPNDKSTFHVPRSELDGGTQTQRPTELST